MARPPVDRKPTPEQVNEIGTGLSGRVQVDKIAVILGIGRQPDPRVAGSLAVRRRRRYKRRNFHLGFTGKNNGD
jgi:hypothetical protein